MEKREAWHLSKGVPITLIVALIIQGAAIVWTVSSMNAAIGTNTDRIVRVENSVENNREKAQGQAVQLGRIEASIDAMHETLQHISSQLARRD